MSKLAMSHFLWLPENLGPAYIRDASAIPDSVRQKPEKFFSWQKPSQFCHMSFIHEPIKAFFCQHTLCLK